MLTTATRREIRSVARVLRSGGIAIIPTDTVYGLAASLDHPDAIERLFEIKGRPADKPIPILVDTIDSAARTCACFPEVARRLAEAYWPGALTIVVKAGDGVPERCLGNGRTVGLRVPAYPVTIELLKMCGGALAVTSANLSGEPETTSAEDARSALAVDAVLDTGPTPGGVPSTVVDVTQDRPLILRHGAIVQAQIVEALAR